MATPPKKNPDATDTEHDTADALARVSQALRGLRFGEVRLVVHDGAVVQVERTEKLRLPPSRPPSTH